MLLLWLLSYCTIHSLESRLAFYDPSYLHDVVTNHGKDHAKLGEIIKQHNIKPGAALGVVGDFVLNNLNPYHLTQLEIYHLLYCARKCCFKAEHLSMRTLLDDGKISKQEFSEWATKQEKLIESNSLL